MKRRGFLGLSVGGAIAALSPRAAAQTTIKEIRIGYQKTGVLVIARQQAVLEKRFAEKQVGIKWIEFTSGPPLLEAMSIGSVDLGAVGDTPPIFAQAANANVVYVAGSRITNGQGILVPTNSSIRTIADLKGKRISVGAPKSGTELNARAVLKAAGLSYKDFAKVEYLPFGESVELMKNRQLDVTLQSAGLGVSALRDLSVSMKIVVVEVPADIVAKVGDAAYQPTVIPANTYEGQTKDVQSIAIQNFLVTHEGVSADTVYKMTKALWENLDAIAAAHASGKTIKRENALKGMPLPLHPGAEKYYREVGLLK